MGSAGRLFHLFSGTHTWIRETGTDQVCQYLIVARPLTALELYLAIPVESEPLKILDAALDGTASNSRSIDILDAKQQPAASTTYR
jgi:hypothetical protein